MEPFRPLIDRRVVEWIASHDAAAGLDSATKNWLIGEPRRAICLSASNARFSISCCGQLIHLLSA